MKHDYESALRRLDRHPITFSTMERVEFEATIIHALKLAHKVTQEPSKEMIMAAIDSYNNNGGLALVTHHKAMIAQAIKEIEG